MSPMATLRAWLGVARAPFLLLPVTLVAAGAAASFYEGALGWLPTLLALVGLVALHIAVNALNEASDMATGIDLHTERTPFSGGSGTLPAGRLSVRATRIFALTCAGIGGAIGVHFALELGWGFVALGTLGAAAVLLYSEVFARAGLGEIFAGLGLGALPVWGAAWVQGRPPGPPALWAGIPAFFMTFNLLLLNEFPDEEADSRGGRRNIVLLFGRRAAAGIYALAVLLVPASLVLAVGLGALPRLALVAALPSLMLAEPLRWAFTRPEEPVPVPALGANVAWNLATNTVLALALLAATLLR
jgi:1,4-dihydroxy-2-naphthoate octaprenyltransferase